MKLSIITINYNNAAGLKKTLDSVAAQTYREFEHIIIDGGSSDGSCPIIKSYEEEIIAYRFNNQTVYPLISWVSERDDGIYNAMNKGLKKAQGEYTLMLNSGDYLVDEYVIERIMPELHTEDMIQGNIIEDFPNQMVRNRGYGKSDISFFDALGGNFLHQALFIRVSTMERYGYYDESYKKSADTYFLIKSLSFGNATFRYVDIDIANYDVNGISSMQDPKWKQIGKEEYARFIRENISDRLMDVYLNAPKKIQLYDTLHKHKWAWYVTMLLVRIINWVTPKKPICKIEEINRHGYE